MKRITALVCSAILVFCSGGVAAAGSQVEELNSYGIMRGDPDGSFRTESNLTCAEAACMIFRMTGINEAAVPAAEGFEELEGHWSYSEVACAGMSGLVDPDEFSADRHITYGELVKMLVTLLGYKPMAESMGGAPHGYIAVASNLGLFNGISVKTDSTITRGEAAVLLANGLDVPLMKQIGFGADVSYAVMDGTGDTSLETLRTNLEE